MLIHQNIVKHIAHHCPENVAMLTLQLQYWGRECHNPKSIWMTYRPIKRFLRRAKWKYRKNIIDSFSYLPKVSLRTKNGVLKKLLADPYIRKDRLYETLELAVKTRHVEAFRYLLPRYTSSFYNKYIVDDVNLLHYWYRLNKHHAPADDYKTLFQTISYSDTSEQCIKNHHYYRVLSYVQYITGKNTWTKSVAAIAASKGNLRIVKKCMRTATESIIDSVMVDAYRNDHLHIVKYCVRSGIPITYKNMYDYYTVACICRNLKYKCVLYLVKKQKLNVHKFLEVAYQQNNIKINPMIDDIMRTYLNMRHKS